MCEINTSLVWVESVVVRDKYEFGVYCCFTAAGRVRVFLRMCTYVCVCVCVFAYVINNKRTRISTMKWSAYPHCFVHACATYVVLMFESTSSILILILFMRMVLWSEKETGTSKHVFYLELEDCILDSALGGGQQVWYSSSSGINPTWSSDSRS